jgi:hypothetical protein
MATKYQQTSKHEPETCFICLGLKWSPELGWYKPIVDDALYDKLSAES